jgi:hypothetical protein
MKAKLQDLYGRIYDFTDVANDEALEIMDNELRASGLTDAFERWLDGEDMELTFASLMDGEDMEQAGAYITDAEAEALCVTFEDILDTLDFEFGDGKWDE